MNWIPPPEKDTAAATLEKHLCDSVHQFRPNSNLKAMESSLGDSAVSKGQGRGELYTPGSIVRLLTEVIERCPVQTLDSAGGSDSIFGPTQETSSHLSLPSGPLSSVGEGRRRAALTSLRV